MVVNRRLCHNFTFKLFQIITLANT